MILDFHCHIGKARYSYKPKEFTPEQLLQRMDQTNVDMACCFSFFEPEMIDNEFVANCGKRFDRLISFAFVNPQLAKSADELEKLARDRRVRGIKLHPYIHGYLAHNTFLLDPIYEVAQKYNLAILCHTFSESPNNMPSAIGYMAGRFPKVNIVMAHGGFMWARQEAVNESKNIRTYTLVSLIFSPGRFVMGLIRLARRNMYLRVTHPGEMLGLKSRS